MAVIDRDIRKKAFVKWTLDQFLSFEDRAQVKHQLIDGKVYERPGGTGEHSEIKVNLIFEVQLRLRGSDFRVYNSDMLIKVDDHNAIYSDTCVVRGAPVYDDSRHLALLNPFLSWK